MRVFLYQIRIYALLLCGPCFRCIYVNQIGFWSKDTPLECLGLNKARIRKSFWERNDGLGVLFRISSNIWRCLNWCKPGQGQMALLGLNWNQSDASLWSCMYFVLACFFGWKFIFRLSFIWFVSSHLSPFSSHIIFDHPTFLISSIISSLNISPGSCYSVALRNNHMCVENSMHHHCPICYEVCRS